MNLIQATLIKQFNSGAIKAKWRRFTCDFQPSVASEFKIQDKAVFIPLNVWIEQKAFQNYEWSLNSNNPKLKALPHSVKKPNGVKTSDRKRSGTTIRNGFKQNVVYRKPEAPENRRGQNKHYVSPQRISDILAGYKKF